MQAINNEIFEKQTSQASESWLGAFQILFVLVSTAQIFFSMWWTSPTADEKRHFEWSQSIIEKGVVDRHVNSVTQAPVINVLTSYLDKSIPSTILKEDFSGQRLWFFMRLGTIFWFFMLVAGVRGLLKMTSMPYAEMLGVALVTSDPTILAHSALVTVDIAFAATVVWFLFIAYKYVLSPTCFMALALGFFTMSLFATKFTAILFVPIFLLALVAPIIRKFLKKIDLSYSKILGFTILALVTFFILINAIFLFIDTRHFLTDYSLKSPILLRLVDIVPNLYLPLPQSFIDGIDQCLNHERNMSWNVIFNDKWFPNGTFWYFPFMYLYKNTLLTLGLVGVSLLIGFKDGLVFVQKLLLVVILFTLSYFCFFFKTQVGIRYIIFVFPLIYIFVSMSLARRLDLNSNIIISLLVYLNTFICLYPNQGTLLTYFNTTFVSSSKPYLYIVDSNFDWFSSYYQLRQEQEKRYFEFDVIDPTFAQPGVNLYSTNHIAGVMWDFQRNKWLRRNIEPDERIAQTYFKFDLTKQKYRDYIKGAHEFKPVENTHLKCKSRIEIDKNTKNETVVLSSDEYICLKILKSGEYVFRSDRYRQNIGILTSTNRCSSNDLKKNEYVPFYFHKGNYVLCSMKLYSGIVSHLDNEIE